MAKRSSCVFSTDEPHAGLTELGLSLRRPGHDGEILALPDGIFWSPAQPFGKARRFRVSEHDEQAGPQDHTVEDPVEYQLNGINQVPVNVDVGMTFPMALRAMLRQAPNIIMVGEIRDLETASIASMRRSPATLSSDAAHQRRPARLPSVDIRRQKIPRASSVRAIMRSGSCGASVPLVPTLRAERTGVAFP